MKLNLFFDQPELSATNEAGNTTVFEQCNQVNFYEAAVDIYAVGKKSDGVIGWFLTDISIFYNSQVSSGEDLTFFCSYSQKF